MEQKTGIRSIERMLDILECFDDRRAELGVFELAELTALPNATVYRIAQTLAARGYLNQDQVTKKYKIGHHFLFFGKLFLNNLDLLQVARPYIDRIRDEINESVKLYLWNGSKRICLGIAESSHALQDKTKVGDELVVHLGAAGKVILAFAPEGTAEGDLEELARIRRQGYAISHGERVSGISSVSVPVFDHQEQVIGSISIAGPSSRFQQMDLTRYIEVALRNGRAVSQAMGANRQATYST